MAVQRGRGAGSGDALAEGVPAPGELDAAPRTAPVLSICIPTYNRAAFLDLCLTRLEPLRDHGIPFEVVISDNGSTDETPGVVEDHRARLPQLRLHRQPRNRVVWDNIVNVYRLARGDIVTYLADDDSLIIDNLVAHVRRMQDDPELAAIFTDWIAWDDQAGREMHRYFALPEGPVEFTRERPLDLINFVFQRGIPAEIGVYRRKAQQASRGFVSRTVGFYPWMYGLLRQGKLRFDPLPFYREQRIPKEGLARTHWANMDMKEMYVNDETRLAMENTLLMALQDAGATHLAPDQWANAHRMIESAIHARTNLEVERAIARGDFIAAAEMRRRVILWNGPGDAAQLQADVSRIVLPAAARAIALTFSGLSDAKAVRLMGFATPWLANFLKQWAPDMPVDAEAALHGDEVLLVHRDAVTRDADPSPDAAEALLFADLVRTYSVARTVVDLSGL
jgi:hypothetical protein